MKAILSGATSPHPGLILPGRAVGAGGGKGGGAAFVEAKNTHRSRATVRVVDLLSEGPILGLEDGSRSIFLNNTPLVGPDGTDNFLGVSWELRLGLVDQEPLRGFSIAENSIPVEFEVKQGVGPATRTYSSDTATLARVVLRFPALFFQDSKNNKLTTAPLNYTIMIRPEGGSFAIAHNVNLRQAKWMAPYEKEHLVVLPESPTRTWDIRVTKITPDPDPEQSAPNAKDNQKVTANSVIWATTGLVTERKMIYPNSALIALSFDSSTFGSSLPERWYKLMGRLVKIPSNFDPVHRVYAMTGPGVTGGMWDGVTFKNAWTNNPAWVCYDALINTRYASGLDENLLTMTRFELYMIGQYCDELVPDGYGGYEPRYSLNAWINTADDAYRFLQRIVQTFRGMSFWAAGQVSIACDMPAEPVKVVTNANVVDGEFIYEGASLKTMHTMARVAYLEPDLRYDKEVEVVDDPDRLALFGERIIDIEAFGCTSRAEAHRLGKWALDTEAHSTEMVSYGCGLDQVDLRPGDVIMVLDQWREGVRGGGRVRESGTNWVLLDSKFEQTSSGYQLSTVRSDGTLQIGMDVASFDDVDPNYTKVFVVGTFVEPPMVGSVWIIATDDVPSRQFRVLAIQENKPGMAKVTGLLHDPTKYERVEQGVSLGTDALHIQTPLADPIPPPTAIDAVNTVYGDGVVTISRLTSSVTPARDARVAGHQFRATSMDTDVATTLFASDSTADFDNLPAGDYTISARSVGVDDRKSVWLDRADPVAVTAVRSALKVIVGVIAEGGVRRVLIRWTPPDDRTDIRAYEVWRASTHLTNPEDDGGTLVDTTYATQTTDNQHGILLPGTTWYYWVRAIDLTNVKGPFSEPDSATVQTVGNEDLGDHSITHEKIMYAGISRTVHDELSMPFDASASTDEVILSVTVDVDAGGKVIVIGRVYTPNLSMAGGEEPFGGGGGTEIPDSDLEDPYTTDPIEDPFPGFALATAWISGGGGRAAVEFAVPTGIGGISWLAQQRRQTAAVAALSVEISLTDGVTGLDKLEVSPPPLTWEDFDWSWSGTFNYAARLSAPSGWELSLNGTTGWGAVIYASYTKPIGASLDSTTSFSVSHAAVTVYYRAASAPATVLSTTSAALTSTTIDLITKTWLHKAKVLTSSEAAATGFYSAASLQFSAATLHPDLTSLEVNNSGSYGTATNWSLSNSVTDSEGADVVTTAGTASDQANDYVALNAAWAASTIVTGNVAQNTFSGSGNIEADDGFPDDLPWTISGECHITLTKSGSFFSDWATTSRTDLSSLDGGGYYGVVLGAAPGVTANMAKTGSQEIYVGGGSVSITTNWPDHTGIGISSPVHLGGAISDVPVPPGSGLPHYEEAYPSWPVLTVGGIFRFTVPKVASVISIKQRPLDA